MSFLYISAPLHLFSMMVEEHRMNVLDIWNPEYINLITPNNFVNHESSFFLLLENYSF
jgi:hypothetical protein